MTTFLSRRLCVEEGAAPVLSIKGRVVCEHAPTDPSMSSFSEQVKELRVEGIKLCDRHSELFAEYNDSNVEFKKQLEVDKQVDEKRLTVYKKRLDFQDEHVRSLCGQLAVMHKLYNLFSERCAELESNIKEERAAKRQRESE